MRGNQALEPRRRKGIAWAHNAARGGIPDLHRRIEMTKELPEEKRTRCEVWTRVMGYHRPVSGWNEGKKSEYRERKYFREPAQAERNK